MSERETRCLRCGAPSQDGCADENPCGPFVCAPAPAEAMAPMQVRINLLCPNGHTRTITTSCACHPAEAVAWGIRDAGGLIAPGVFVGHDMQDSATRQAAFYDLERPKRQPHVAIPLFTHPAPARGEAVTKEMVERGAAALRDQEVKMDQMLARPLGKVTWLLCDSHTQEAYRQDARLVLSAALARPDRERGK